MENTDSYVDNIAQMSVIKAKAAYFCPEHPAVIISTGNTDAKLRAHSVAQNTLQFNDKQFLNDSMAQAVTRQLELAHPVCPYCNSVEHK
ncbi:MAG TPA: hypothetical protein VGN64_22675 [Dyadobacter sp.]|nr:hypothetical protein [Dyadobacter sp.]